MSASGCTKMQRIGRERRSGAREILQGRRGCNAASTLRDKMRDKMLSRVCAAQ